MHATVDRLTILLIDDDRRQRDCWQRLLTDRGHLVLCAAGLEEAVESAATCRPDVVVTDWHLGYSADGRQVIDRLGETAGLPVVVCTGDLAAAARLELHPELGVAVVTKPCTVDDLLRACRLAIDDLVEEDLAEADADRAESEVLLERESAWGRACAAADYCRDVEKDGGDPGPRARAIASGRFV